MSIISTKFPLRFCHAIAKQLGLDRFTFALIFAVYPQITSSLPVIQTPGANQIKEKSLENIVRIISFEFMLLSFVNISKVTCLFLLRTRYSYYVQSLFRFSVGFFPILFLALVWDINFL